MDAKQEFLNLLEDTAAEIGADLTAAKDQVAGFMAERSQHLSTIVNESGFAEAVKREAKSVALEAGLQASDVAHGTDQRWFDIIATGLRLVAVALV